MYKVHLILKYLFKRRIAWVSIVAVALCTLMVLVVMSVMGGWLNNFKKSFRGLSGDIVIHADTLKGFPYYQQVIDAIEKDPACQVQAAVPSIETAGLFNHGTGPIPVRVMGLDIANIDQVNKFGDSLFLQHSEIERELADPATPASQRPVLLRALNQPPSFDLHDEVLAELAVLPAQLSYAKPAEGQTLDPGTIATPDDFPKFAKNHLRYDALRHNLLYRGNIVPFVADFKALSPDPAYQKAIDQLATELPFANYPPVRGKYNGLIVGTGVIGIRRNQQSKWDRAGQAEWERPTHLTVLDLSGNHVDAESQVTRNFFIVDDSHLGVWQYDSSYVYVAFSTLQKDLGLDAQNVTVEGQDVVMPARATDIHIRVKPGIDVDNEPQLSSIRDHIEKVVQRVLVEQEAAHPLVPIETGTPAVETWQDVQRIWINAVENEKLLTLVLFGIMCIVAIFLIFCIFYMIVVEKTRDIGIIKSVGATLTGVAGIFLGYGYVIGIVGTAFGVTLAFFIVRYINELHAALGRLLHVQIWDPQVYLFDSIPNKLDPSDAIWIALAGIVACMLGALIPAIRAARLNPVDSLRWE